MADKVKESEKDTETEEEDEVEATETGAETESTDTETSEEEAPDAAKLKEEIESLKSELERVKAESIKRRKKIDELKKGKSDSATTGADTSGKANGDGKESEEVRKLREQNEKLQAEVLRGKARSGVIAAARASKIIFANDQALEDAVEFVLRDAEINDDGSVEDALDLLKDVVKQRPHLIGTAAKPQPKAGDTSADKRGGTKEKVMSDDEKREFAARWGVKPQYISPK